MDSNINLITAQIPSTMGAPALSHAMTTSARCIAVPGTSASIAWSLVCDRSAVVVGAMGFAQGYPGTSAWRPPNC